MTKTELYNKLNYVNHTREKRTEMAHMVRNDPTLVPVLLSLVFEVDDPVSSKACWVLEFVVKENLSLLFPHLDTFIANMGSVYLDSSVRPLAKICECLVLAYFSKNNEQVQLALSEKHLEQMVTSCFDWLIGDYKVAAKAYSMTSLYLLGRKFPWVHPELRLVIEQNYATGSAAYKARARHTLAKLK
ncbi:adenylosuccinate lyase [Spongiimicrobium sp. 3-5]|uniref:adenylosuccinate lyase n=1 Tax=Spongiimicrobium sp. 3-5 TaxID=3332596 RepID=UPI0039805D83